MNIFEKLKFKWRKPKLIIIQGEGKKSTKEALLEVLKDHLKIGEEIFIFDEEIKNFFHLNNVKFLMRNSSFVIFIITHYGDIPFEQDFFASEKEKTIFCRQLVKLLAPTYYLVLNFDDETVRGIGSKTNSRKITFGLQGGADFRATNIFLNGGTNFKSNYDGKIIPIWLEKVFGKENIYSALAASVVGTILGLNLVEISQKLKRYKGCPGKMNLIEGIKKSFILDASASENLFSIMEAIEIFGKIDLKKNYNKPQRKIVVFGDFLKAGKYGEEAHLAIGEKAAKIADLLFAFGHKSKFIAIEAEKSGLAKEKIFHFENIKNGKLRVQDEIKEGDLILIAGSKQTGLEEIIDEIKKI